MQQERDLDSNLHFQAPEMATKELNQQHCVSYPKAKAASMSLKSTHREQRTVEFFKILEALFTRYVHQKPFTARDQKKVFRK